ncbi:hypothetical protein J6590_104453, partial [Homalodisca vitripennis]
SHIPYKYLLKGIEIERLSPQRGIDVPVIVLVGTKVFRIQRAFRQLSWRKPQKQHCEANCDRTKSLSKLSLH